MIKLIATDMDGTLLDDNKQMPAGFEKWVEDHSPEINVVIASGRQHQTLLDNMGSLAPYLFYICENGALAYAKDKLIHSDIISTKDVVNTLKLLKKIPKATPILCCADAAISEPLPPEIEAQRDTYYHSSLVVPDLLSAAKEHDVCKIATYCADDSAENVYNSLDLPSEKIVKTLSAADWVDVNNASVNKGDGMRKIQKHLGLSPDECMAFGDYLNDLELLEACTHSYAMENGHPKLKKIAAHIAPSNNEAGVMQVLEQLDA